MIVFRLAQLLEKRKWSAYRLAQESGLPQPTVYRLVSERPNTDVRISLKVLDALCRAFGCDVGDLLQYQPDVIDPPKKRRRT